jgi:hypothetical protein
MSGFERCCPVESKPVKIDPVLVRAAARQIKMWCLPMLFATRFSYVSSLRTLRSLHDLKLNHISFLQGAITVTNNRGIMNEDVGTIIAPYESVTFCVIEPFHRSAQTSPSCSCVTDKLLSREKASTAAKRFSYGVCFYNVVPCAHAKVVLRVGLL